MCLRQREAERKRQERKEMRHIIILSVIFPGHIYHLLITFTDGESVSAKAVAMHF